MESPVGFLWPIGEEAIDSLPAENLEPLEQGSKPFRIDTVETEVFYLAEGGKTESPALGWTFGFPGSGDFSGCVFATRTGLLGVNRGESPNPQSISRAP